MLSLHKGRHSRYGIAATEQLGRAMPSRLRTPSGCRMLYVSMPLDTFSMNSPLRSTARLHAYSTTSARTKHTFWLAHDIRLCSWKNSTLERKLLVWWNAGADKTVLPRPLKTSPRASGRVLPCSKVTFAASSSYRHSKRVGCTGSLPVAAIIMQARTADWRLQTSHTPQAAAYHVLSDQFLEFEHDTRACRQCCIPPRWICILCCLDGSIELPLCGLWQA